MQSSPGLLRVTSLKENLNEKKTFAKLSFVVFVLGFVSSNSVQAVHVYIKPASAMKHAVSKVKFLFVESFVDLSDLNIISFTCLSNIKCFHFICTHRACFCCKTCYL